MRARLYVVFLVPVVGILLVLGGAYALSAARAAQQEFYSARLGDLSYFVTSARQALVSGDGAVLNGEVSRFAQLYDIDVAVLDRAGTVWLTSSDEPPRTDPGTADQIELALAGRRAEVPTAIQPWSTRPVTLVDPVLDDGNVIGVVVLSANLDVPRSTTVRQIVTLLAAAAVAIGLGVLVVRRLASWVLAPIRRVDRAMAAVEAGDMDARIADDTGPPELRRMIRVFNAMAGELERVFVRQREFALNASHELRNPLGALLMRIETMATGLPPGHEGDAEAAREEGRRMTRILDTLLSLAHADQGNRERRPVDLAGLVERRVAAWRPAARDKGITVHVTVASRAVIITDETVIESALDAILDNSLKYAPHGAQIRIMTADDAGNPAIIVTDDGPGLDPADVARATDRYWRSAHNPDGTSGSGLGLAIAANLLESIGGQLRIAAPDDGGFEARLELGVNAA